MESEIRALTMFVHTFLRMHYPRLSRHPDVDVHKDLCGFCATGALILQKLLHERGIEAVLVAGWPPGWGPSAVCHYWVLALDADCELIHADPTFLQFDRQNPTRVEREAPRRFDWCETVTLHEHWDKSQHPETHFPLLGLGSYSP